MKKVLAALAAVLVMVLGAFTVPAAAAAGVAEDGAAARDDVQAITVGSLAFMLMITAAGAVVYYTARSR
ncbi:hypothetical protein [Qaidamihabitans albus]|uniref:hypothetical protein n=1 Tax=Qaidamihabitans albus TaxID=2795733 RepID=UPI0018F10938|nr:hypothetical protein [Qaidamihabitans albus]